MNHFAGVVLDLVTLLLAAVALVVLYIIYREVAYSAAGGAGPPKWPG